MISPGKFNRQLYYYDNVIDKRLHSTVQTFLFYTRSDFIDKYCTKHRGVQKNVLEGLLDYKPKHFFWSGTDLYKVATGEMIVLETNSCPSGQKSMPTLPKNKFDVNGYSLLMYQFLELANKKNDISGVLAVIYDKNYMEVSGYAKEMANLSGERIHLVEIDDENENIRWENDILHVFCKDAGDFLPVRAAFRYVTQRPWAKIPIHSRTFIFNPVLSCLAGGRNKLVAHKAYEKFNKEFENFGFKIHTPATICDVVLENIEEIVRAMNYKAVIKIPYSNAGQGVFTIHNRGELEEFLVGSFEIPYQKYIIQELIVSNGTKVDAHGHKYVFDMRFMIYFTERGYEPLVLYARRALMPFVEDNTGKSRDIYLTNLSEKTAGGWTTHNERLLLMDEIDFPSLDIDLENLVDAYFQSVFATIAIDKMACEIYDEENGVNEFFRQLNDDKTLFDEIL